MKKLLIVVCMLLLSGCSIKQKMAVMTNAKPSNHNFTEAASDLQSAVASGKPAKCLTKTDIAGVKTEAQMYIDTKGERFRMMTKVVVNPKMNQLGNSLKIKDQVYSWGEGAKEGVTMSLKQVAKNATSVDPKSVPSPATPTAMATMSAEDVAKLSEQINTTCEVWELDEAMFKIPSDVKFVDQMAKIKELTDKAKRK